MSNDEKRGHASLGYLTKEGFRGIRANKLMSLASIAVLMSCLLLIGVAYLLVINVNNLLGNVMQQNVIKVYLLDDATREQAIELGDRIEELPYIRESRFVPKEEAYRDILESLGSDAVLLDGMENPLPDAYDVILNDMAQYDETAARLSKLDNVQGLRQDRDLARILTSLKNTVGSISLAVIVMLLVVSLFIISNTVRITMFSRRLEITIMKSVGATKWFIRWPFIVEGVVLGVIAGVAALGAVGAVYKAMTDAVSKMNQFLLVFAKPVAFSDHVWTLLIAFIVIGVLTGTFGSYVSMNKYLKEQSYDSESVISDHA